MGIDAVANLELPIDFEFRAVGHANRDFIHPLGGRFVVEELKHRGRADRHVGVSLERHVRPFEGVDSTGRLHHRLAARVGGTFETNRINGCGGGLNHANAIFAGRGIAGDDAVRHVLQDPAAVVAREDAPKLPGGFVLQPHLDPLVDKLVVGRGDVQERLRGDLAPNVGRDFQLRAGEHVFIAGADVKDLRSRRHSQVGHRDDRPPERRGRILGRENPVQTKQDHHREQGVGETQQCAAIDRFIHVDVREGQGCAALDRMVNLRTDFMAASRNVDEIEQAALERGRGLLDRAGCVESAHSAAPRDDDFHDSPATDGCADNGQHDSATDRSKSAGHDPVVADDEEQQIERE